MTFSRTAFLATAALAAISGAANASVIVDTGPAPADASYRVFESGMSGNAGIAGRFTLTEATTLTAIDFYGAATSGIVGAIHADGTTPGATLYSGTLAGTDNSVNQWVGLNGLAWVLGPGSYWVSFESQAAGNVFREARNFPNPLPQQDEEAFGVYTANRTDAFAFRVEGDAVTAAVPEPATWAMMIGGFGLIGGALRRRQVGVVVA